MNITFAAIFTFQHFPFTVYHIQFSCCYNSSLYLLISNISIYPVKTFAFIIDGLPAKLEAFQHSFKMSVSLSDCM